MNKIKVKESVNIFYTVIQTLYAFCQSEWKAIIAWVESKIALTDDNS